MCKHTYCDTHIRYLPLIFEHKVIKLTQMKQLIFLKSVQNSIDIMFLFTVFMLHVIQRQMI